MPIRGYRGEGAKGDSEGERVSNLQEKTGKSKTI